MADPVQNAETLKSPEIDDPFGWVGHVLEGKYAIEALIGEGGFAVVYRAHHKGLDDRIAVKCLKIPKKLAGEERDRFLQSFLDEGKLLHRLSRADAGIVQALDVGAATSPNGTWTPFLVLEWLDGRTLEDDPRASAGGTRRARWPKPSSCSRRPRAPSRPRTRRAWRTATSSRRTSFWPTSRASAS